VSARVEDPRLGTTEQRAATIVVLVGVAVLVLRPFVDAAPSTRTALFAASYLTIGLASIAVPLERDRVRMAPGLALLLGLGGVVAAASVSGSPVPLPWSSAALPLSVLAAVAEEALFRRLAYGRLERFGAAVAIVGSALLFGLVHVPAYGLAALPRRRGGRVALRVAAVGLGTWTVPAATHAFANALVVLR
jgi:membrane protease YdiL (CAAX protease family)